MSEWLTPAQAAAHAKRHPETIRVALRTGEIKGVQSGSNCRWLTKPSWVDAWIMGEAPAAA
jgi:hypothetical protein